MEHAAQRIEEVKAWWRGFAASRDPALRALLIEHYMPLARIVAARLYSSGIARPCGFDDYLQYARVGLIEAVDRFDPDRNVSFESYSSHRIRGAVLNGLSETSEAAAQRDFWRTRMPDRIHSLTTAQGKDVARASLEDLKGLTVGIALSILLEREQEPVDESPQANPYAAAELAQLSSRLHALVAKLPDREREIIRGHYFERLEFQVLAERFGVTKGRLSQLHGRALQRLAQMLADGSIDRRL